MNRGEMASLVFGFVGKWGCANAIPTLTEIMRLASTHLDNLSSNVTAAECNAPLGRRDGP